MKLVIKATSPPPEKKFWHDPDPTSRGEWSSIYETVTNWFCTSHDFNHHHDLVLIYGDLIIELIGQEIRYLAPPLRSAASLIFKAYQTGQSLEIGERKQSSPGIYVSYHRGESEFPKPHYYLVMDVDLPSTDKIIGTVFTYPVEAALQYRAPASRLSQAIVWLVQAISD
jgi:tRNA pseudouridine-54 N-methylase